MNHGQFKQHAENTVKELTKLFDADTNLVLEFAQGRSLARLYVGDKKTNKHWTLNKPIDPNRAYVSMAPFPKGFAWNVMFLHGLNTRDTTHANITVEGQDLAAISAKHIHTYLTTSNFPTSLFDSAEPALELTPNTFQSPG